MSRPSYGRGRRLLIVVVALLAANLAHADDALNARIETMLAAGIDTPVTSDAFASLGPGVVPELIALYEREAAPRHVRLRALGVLGELDDPRAAAFLEQIVSQAAASTSEARARSFATSGLVLRRALSGLEARPHLGLAPAAIVPLLEHREASVRQGAARLLTRLSDRPEVRKRLAERLAREPSRAVRATLDAALTGRFARPTGLRLVRPESAQPPR